jgi:hypothetical protein
MLKQIDEACGEADIQPDLHLSGHAHLYERFTRTVGKKQIPYLVAGMGGFYNLPGLKPPNHRPPSQKTPQSGTDASGNPLRLEVYNDNTFGFLRLTVSPTSIAGVFVTVDPASGNTGVGDSFTVDLQATTVSGGGSDETSGAHAGKRTASSKAKPASRPPAKRASKVGAKPPKAKSKSTAARTERR